MLNKKFKIIIKVIVFIIFFIPYFAFSNSKKCEYDKNICDILNQVVGIKTPMMVASGTLINDELIVTNRHVVEDHEQFIIRFNNGEIKKPFHYLTTFLQI